MWLWRHAAAVRSLALSVRLHRPRRAGIILTESGEAWLAAKQAEEAVLAAAHDCLAACAAAGALQQLEYTLVLPGGWGDGGQLCSLTSLTRLLVATPMRFADPLAPLSALQRLNVQLALPAFHAQRMPRLCWDVPHGQLPPGLTHLSWALTLEGGWPARHKPPPLELPVQASGRGMSDLPAARASHCLFCVPCIDCHIDSWPGHSPWAHSCPQVFVLTRLASLEVQGRAGPLICKDWPALAQLTALRRLRVANFDALPTGLVAALRGLTQLQDLELADLREEGAAAARHNAAARCRTVAAQWHQRWTPPLPLCLNLPAAPCSLRGVQARRAGTGTRRGGTWAPRWAAWGS